MSAEHVAPDQITVGDTIESTNSPGLWLTVETISTTIERDTRAPGYPDNGIVVYDFGGPRYSDTTGPVNEEAAVGHGFRVAATQTVIRKT